MKSLYVTSAEIFSGKSALCVGLGYVSARTASMRLCEAGERQLPAERGLAYDEDVVFAKQMFDLSEPSSSAAVALTRASWSSSYAGLRQTIRHACWSISPRCQPADIMVLEGGRSMREGYVVNLPRCASSNS